MARPAINTGSSALQAYMQGVANMGQVRAQMQANTTQAINALGDTFTKWQDDFNKRKHLKWTQQMEEAKLAETKRVNDSNIKVNEGNLAIKQAALPHEIASLNANTALTKQNTEKVRLDNRLNRNLQNYADKNSLYSDPVFVKKALGGDTSTATPNSNGAGTTGNGVQLNNGGVNLGQSDNSNSAMGVANGAKKQNNAATTSTKSTNLSFIPKNYSYTG